MDCKALQSEIKTVPDIRSRVSRFVDEYLSVRKNFNLGTMILAGLNVAVAHQMSLYGQESSIQGPLAGGLSVAIGIYVAANASGGHVNPAVTLAFWSLGRLGNTFLQNTLMLFWYWGAQISGAFVSSIIVYLVYYDAEMANYNADSDDYDFVCLYCTCPTRLYELNKVILFHIYDAQMKLGRKKSTSILKAFRDTGCHIPDGSLFDGTSNQCKL